MGGPPSLPSPLPIPSLKSIYQRLGQNITHTCTNRHISDFPVTLGCTWTDQMYANFHCIFSKRTTMWNVTFFYSVIQFINQNVQYNPLTPTVAMWVQL